MAFIPATDTVRVDLVYDLDGQNCLNTLWFKFRAGAPTLPDLTALGVGVNDYWTLAMMPLLSDTLVYNGNIVYDWSSPSAPAVNTPSGTAGGQTDPPLPNAMAFCITFLTGGRGKSSRGRNFIMGIPDSYRAGANRIDSGNAANFVSVYTGILGSAIDADWEWSVVSFFTANAPRAAGLVQPIIGAGASDLILDTQRRRGPGRGG